jgi:small-conductance mechanosensitive channel/CRP-like cAMP-binding protein
MLPDWLTTSIIILILAGLLSALVWRLRGVKPNRMGIISVLLAIVTSQILFLERGSFTLPEPSDPMSQKILAAAALVLAFNAAIQLVKSLFLELVVSRRRLKLPRFVIDLISWLVLLVIGLLVVRSIFGIVLTGVLVTSTVASAVLGLALQDVLSNLIAGIALQAESPFSIGDWVRIGDQEGEIVRQNWRTISLLTIQNHHIIITNNNVANVDITNFSRPTRLQVQSAHVGVVYQHPPGLVKQVLLEGVKGTEGIMDDPEPEVLVREYGDFAIEYQIRYWITDYSRWLHISDHVMTRIWYALKRNGMTIPFPIRDVNLRLVTPEKEAAAVAEQKTTIALTLRSLSLLEKLSDDQIERLAGAAHLHRYTTGETLVRQGDQGDSLFIIRSGRVSIQIRNQAGRQLVVNQRSSGEFFGEMSLLTGQPRSASVIADEETEVVIIGKEPFANVLTADPAILEAFLDAVEKRRGNLETRLAAADAQAQQQPDAGDRLALLQRIASFLGLPSL